MIDMEPIRRQVSSENITESLHRRQKAEKAIAGGSTPSQPSSEGLSSDSIKVSEKAIMMGRIQKAFAEIADIRTELVTEIKTKIETDDYHVPGEKIAEQVILEALKEMKSFGN